MALASLLTVASACASMRPAPPATPSLVYQREAIERIMALREGGESLANVAKVVGGTRTDVRLAERKELARLRAIRSADPRVGWRWVMRWKRK
jgi:hypothetical protein